MGKKADRADQAGQSGLVTEDLGGGCYAFSGPGFSTSGAIVGERGVIVVDTQADEDRAAEVLQALRRLTDKPIRYCVLTHFHCDRTLGALVFEPVEIIGSDLTKRLMMTRGREEAAFAARRTPSRVAEHAVRLPMVPPSLSVASSVTLELGNCEVRVMHLGRGHTVGDTIVWVPGAGVLYAGDVVQHAFAPYCGDANLSDWLRALDRITAFRPATIVPGYGAAALGAANATAAIETTRDFITTLKDAASACAEQNLGLKETYNHCGQVMESRFSGLLESDTHLPFNVARAYDEAHGLDVPQAWSSERLADVHDALSGNGSTVGQSLEAEPQNTDEPIGVETPKSAEEQEPSVAVPVEEAGDLQAQLEALEALDASGAISETGGAAEAAASDEPDLVSDESFEDALLGVLAEDGETTAGEVAGNEPDTEGEQLTETGLDDPVEATVSVEPTADEQTETIAPENASEGGHVDDSGKSLDEIAAEYMRDPAPSEDKNDERVVKVLADAPS